MQYQVRARPKFDLYVIEIIYSIKAESISTGV